MLNTVHYAYNFKPNIINFYSEENTDTFLFYSLGTKISSTKPKEFNIKKSKLKLS